MKSQEIRIGNFFSHNGNWSYRECKKSDVICWNDTDWYAVGECTMDLNDIIGIPISEIELNNIGFVDVNTGRPHIYINSNLSIVFTKKNTDKIVYIEVENEYASCQIVTYIKFVHQLQNLYFALTGFELECNL